VGVDSGVTHRRANSASQAKHQNKQNIKTQKFYSNFRLTWSRVVGQTGPPSRHWGSGVRRRYGSEPRVRRHGPAAAVGPRPRVRARHLAAAVGQIVVRHLRDSGCTLYRESMLVLGQPCALTHKHPCTHKCTHADTHTPTSHTPKHTQTRAHAHTRAHTHPRTRQWSALTNNASM
jgi:hypothetical protein